MQIIRRRAALGCIALQPVLLALLAAPAAAATVAGGTSHTLVVRTTDGTVWAFGLNSDGQLGDSTVTQRKTPIQVSGLAAVVAVAAGAKHSLALTSSGVLYAWGDNYYGQIGNSNNTDQKLPVQVMSGVAQIAAGDNHTIALKTDGTVHVWGANNEGQLADGGTTNRNTPYEVTGLGLASAVAGGGNHTLVVLVGGAMKSWGKNTNGQLGDGSTYTRATSPVAASGISTATAAAGGYAFSFARLFDGTLYAWGHNTNGQLGFGDTTQRPTPTALATPTLVAAVATGGYHTLALLSDGSLAAWGHNSYGSVGDGSGTQRTSPVAVPGPASVVAIGAGKYHSVAVTSTGEVWTWGYNNYAQVGDGTTANRLAPVQIAEAGFNWKVATPTFSPVPNTYSANQNVTLSCATTGAAIRYTTDGTDPTSSSPLYSSAVPITVSTTLKARAFKAGLAASTIAAGFYTLKVAIPSFSPAGGTYTTPQTVTMTLATAGATIRYTTDGSEPTEESTPYAGPLGVPTTTTLKAAGFKTGWTRGDIRTATYTMNFGTLAAPTFTPSPANYLDSVTVTITAAEGATIRYTTNGSTPTLSSALYTGPVNLTQTTTLKAKAWKVDYTESPVTSGTYTLKVATPLLSQAAGAYPAGTTVTLTAATAGASLNYTLDGDDPTESDPSIPSGGSLVLGNFTLKVRSFKAGCDPSDVVTATYTVSGQLTSGMVAAGEAFSLALLPDGTPFSWGYNGSGRLGDGTTTERWVPAPVSGLTGIVAIAAGSDHGLALDTAGVVWSWGANASGQLGSGTTTARSSPAPVPGLAGVVAIAAGKGLSAALRNDGSLWLWGENGYGQVGAGDTTDRLSPVLVLSDVAHVAAGWYHALAVKTDGSLWSWGYNNVGQLGDGGTVNRSTPGAVSSLSSVIRVAAGQSHSLAQVATGAVHAWGENGSGQLGDTTTTDRFTPTPVGSLAHTLALDGGASHSLAVLTDASVAGWGENGTGQVGDGTTTDRTSPTPVSGLAPIVSVAGGDQHSLAITSDASIWAWGGNANGRLGDGTNTNRLLPVKIRDGAAWRVGTPVLNPAGGSFTSSRTVTVTDKTPGAVIRYTTNGADPTPTDPEIASGGTLNVDQSLTLKAKAWKTGMADSDVATAVFTLTVTTPTITPSGGTFNTPQTVTIACTTPEATIRYTTNGVDPTSADPVIASGGTIIVDATQTVRARAWKTGWSDSAVVSRAFTMVVAAPTMTPSSGSYTSPQTVTLATTTPGATIRHTTNGLEPGPNDPDGTSVLVDGTLTLRAVASKAGWTTSTTTIGTYWLNLGTAATPAFSPPGGTYGTPQEVSITWATPGATVRYTLDGTEPTFTSPEYVSPLAVASSATIKARAFKADYTPSATAIAVYVVDSTRAAPPLISPPSGTYAAGLRVSLVNQTAEATIRYTLDGTDPDETDPALPSGGVVTIGQSLRLKARAWKDGLAASAVAVADFRVVGAVAAGSSFSVVLSADGTVWSFGYNAQGQLGDGTTTVRSLPVQVLTGSGALTDVVAIAAGGSHTLALKADRSVWGWGLNTSGQLGDGTSTNRTRAVQVLTSGGPLTDVVGIAAGLTHSLALKADGSVWAFGANGSGQLGDGTTTGRNLAAAVTSLSGVVGIAAGGNQSAALVASGGTSKDLWAWGANGQGQLGDGTTANRLSPLRLGSAVSAVGCGASHTLRILEDGTVVGSGLNDKGELGDGTSTSPRTTPVAMLGLTDIGQVSAGSDHSLILVDGGSLFGTGSNTYGQVGDGTVDLRTLPVSIASLTGIASIGAGTGHSIALDALGRVYTWGYNSSGQLGLGDTANRTSPAEVTAMPAADQGWLEGDPDADNLTTGEEIPLGGDPLDPDTNDDGVLDGAAARAGLSLTSLDMDGDGVINAAELAAGTDPFRADTDGDAVPDGIDCYPLDPQRTECAAPQPGDVTPPVITLTLPPNAVLVTTTP